jgi:hypothetical protein
MTTGSVIASLLLVTQQSIEVLIPCHDQGQEAYRTQGWKQEWHYYKEYTFGNACNHHIADSSSSYGWNRYSL